MFVTHNDPVYAGMIVGLAPKPGDMIITMGAGNIWRYCESYSKHLNSTFEEMKG